MANSDKNIRITTSKNKTTYPNIVFTGSAAGSSVITLEVLDDNTLSFTSNEGQVFSIDSNLSSGTIWAVSDISGVPMLSSSAGGTVGLATYGGIVGIGQTNPTYKLDLKGSFGLASSNDGLYNFIFSNSAASGSNSLQIRSANSIFLYNSGNSFYTGIKSNAAANVTYTLPTNDGSADQFLKTNGSGILSWGTPAGGSGGGSTGVGQGGQYEVAYYPGTGSSVIGNTNLKNNTATSVVSVSYSTASLDFSTGAFTVSGGVGIGGSLFVGGIGASISGITFSNSLITRGTWNATVISPQYGGTGQNFSSSTGLLRYSSGTASVITTSSDLANVISDETGSGALVFATGPVLVTPNIGAATGTSLYLSATSPSNSITTGAIIVPGGVGVGLSISVGGRLQLFNGANYTAFVSSASASGNTVYTLPATSPATGSSVLQSTSAGILSWVPMIAGSTGAGSGTVAIPDAQFRLAFYAGTGASVSSTNLITAVGTGVTILGTTNASSTTVAALSIIGGLGVTGNAFIGGTTSVTSTQTSISTNSGALVVTGGVGIGGSLYTGTSVASSISGVVLSNGLVTSGTWSGTVVTALYGGTGFNSYAVGDLLVASTGTSLAKLAASSNTGYVLTSTGANSVPTWQAVPPAAATSVAVAPTTVNGQFSITTVNSASGTGLGLSTISTFVVNPSSGLVTISGLAVTSGTNSSSTTTGTLTVYGGIGITGNAFIGGTTNVTSNQTSISTNSGALVVSGGVGVGGSLYTGTSVASSISGVVLSNGLVTSGTWSGTVITALYGGTGFNSYAVGDLLVASTGTSLAKLAASSNTGFVLTSTGANSVPTWQAVPPAAATSVAVAPTTVNGQFSLTAVNSASGTGLGLSTISTLVINPSSGLMTLSGLAVTNGTNSSSTTTGTLTVYGGIGITGNAFIGGTTNITNTNASTSTNSGALVVTGGVGIGGSLFTPTGNASSISGVILSNNAITASTLNRVTVTAPATSATLTLANTSSLITSGAFNLTLITTATTDVTFPSGTKTLVATDVATLGSLTSASSLNTIGTITSGTWAGTVITSLYGGTGFNSYAVGDLLVASTGTSLARLAASSNTGFVLTSTGANSVPTWQAVPPAAATSVAVIPTTVNGQFSLTAVNSASGTGLGLSTISTLVINPSSGLMTLSGLAVTNGINSSSTTTGTLTVYGGLGITGNAFIGGTTSVTSTVTSIGPNSGALVVTGGVGIGGSLYTGTSVASSISGVIHNNGAVTGSSYNRVTITAPATSATLTLSNGSSLITSGGHSLTFTTSNTTNVTVPTTGTLATTSNKLSDFAATTSSELLNTITGETGSGALVFATSPDFTTSVTTGSATFSVFNTTATNISAFGAATTLSIGANSGKATFNSADNSTSTTTGAIVATGGAAVGQSLSIGGRLQIFNSTNYSAFRYTGIANTTYTLPPNSPQASVGTSVLASTIDGTMSWVGLPVASGSGSPGGSNLQVQYNNNGTFAGATGMTWAESNNLLTIQATSTLSSSGTQAALRIANNNTTDPSNNIRWSPALEMIGRSGVSPGFGTTYNNRFATEVVPLGPNDSRAYLRTKYSYDLITGSPSFNNDLFRIHSTLGVGFGASNSTGNAISYFRVSTTQSGEVSYILPPGLPSTGTSVLQSDTSGTLTWVGMAAGGTGSGTVNSGTGGSFAVYGATGTAVIGTNLVTFAGSGVTIGGTTNASSTTVAALVVQGGLGVTGNAFIGGTTTITNTTESTSINSGALTVAGGAGIAKSLFVGTTLAVGSAPGYNIPNNLASFVSNVNSYNQLVIQNRSSGVSASSNLVVNNDQSTDAIFYGELGMNSSNFSGTGALGAPNAVYVASTSAPLVLGTTTQHPIRFAVNGSATDMLYIDGAGLAISCFANFGLRSASDLRFWNTGNTQYAGIQGGNTSNSYILTMPTAQVGAGSSVIVTGSDGNQFFAAPGSGIAFSSAVGNTPIIRTKRAVTMQFCAGYTPTAAGPDIVVLKVPESPTDGLTDVTFRLREIDIRVETPSAGQSRIMLEKYSGTTAFTYSATGTSMIAGFGITLTGAGTHFTSTNTFASGSLVTSNDKLRLNWTLLNATHANFSIQVTMEEV